MANVKIIVETVDNGSTKIKALDENVKGLNQNVGKLSKSYGDTALKQELLRNKTAAYNDAVGEMAKKVQAGTMTLGDASTMSNKLAKDLGLTEQSTQSTGKNFTEMASKMQVAQQAFGMTAAAAGQVWSILEQGSALNLAADRFDNLTASIGTTSDALMNDLSNATGGMMSNAEMMSGASQIISLGLADNQKDVVDLAALVGSLGWDMQQVILTFANNSKMRLDALGLSVTDVEQRAKALEAQGYSTDKAFDLAVIQAGQAKLELLGGAADTGAGAMKRLTVEFDNLKTAALGFIAARSEGALIGLANSADAVGAASDAGHSGLRNFLVVANELGKTLPFTGDGLDDLIGLLEESEIATVSAINSDQNLINMQQQLNTSRQLEAERIAFSTEKLESYMSLESMYGRQGAEIGQSAVNSWRARNEALAAYGETLSNGTGIESQYAAAAMESTAGTNALADSLFRAANAAAAEQAALLGTFNALSQNEEALADYAIIMEGVQTHLVKVSGATDEQKAALEDLQSEYEKAQETITSYQIGVKGVGLTEDERNEKIAEQMELMGQLSAAMEPLSAIQSEYATYTDGGAQATQLLNEKLFGQIQASSDSAAAIALAGVALGVYTEAEANAMLKSALLEEMIRKQAEAWDGTAAGLATIQGNIEGYISVLNGIPDVINTTVSTDYQSTGTPPPWAGGPSSGDVGESEGSWGGEVTDMASGGVVTGGVWGRDSVPAMLMPGEEVLPVNDPRNIRNGGGASNSVVVNVYGAMGANPQAIAGAVTRAITPRG